MGQRFPERAFHVEIQRRKKGLIFKTNKTKNAKI